MGAGKGVFRQPGVEARIVEETMLGVDVAVALALLLSLASVLLCVLYGWSRWDADDDATTVSEGSTDAGTRGGAP